MNAKELKRYSLIITIGTMQPHDPTLPGLFAELAANDYVTAFEMWEYMMTLHSGWLNDVAVSTNLESNIWNVMQRASEARLKQLLPESAPLMRLIYANSATGAMNGNLAYLTALILGSKIDQADEILKLVTANKNTNMDFGDRMKTIIDDVFNVYCTKNNTKVPSLNRKQTMLLLEYALKIKGPNKNLLVQRVKELQ